MKDRAFRSVTLFSIFPFELRSWIRLSLDSTGRPLLCSPNGSMVERITSNLMGT